MKSIEREKFESETLPHLEALMRTALWLTMHGSRAETLIVETVLQEYPIWPTYDSAVDAKVRLFRSLARRFFQHGSLHHQSNTPVIERRPTEPDAVGGAWPDQSNTCDRQQLDRLDGIPNVAFKGAIARLTPQPRLMVLLRWRESFTYDEIAYVTDLSEQTVKTILSRLRQLIPRYLRADAEWMDDPHINSVVGSESPQPLPMMEPPLDLPVSSAKVAAADSAVSDWDNEGGAIQDAAAG